MSLKQLILKRKVEHVIAFFAAIFLTVCGIILCIPETKDPNAPPETIEVESGGKAEPVTLDTGAFVWLISCNYNNSKGCFDAANAVCPKGGYTAYQVYPQMAFQPPAMIQCGRKKEE